jgi:CheY-like chemotaxis protein
VLAEQSLAIKTQFLANMSHEIRTPMNGIMGLTSLALELEINDEVRSYLNYINESAQSLLIVVNDILDFSKIEAGKLAIELLPFSLRGLLNNLQGLFKATTDQKGLALSFKLANTSPDMLIGDVFRLQQILNNLIGNAIKFTASGKIDFNVSVLPRLPEQESDQVRLLFSITDTGIGISDEEKGHLLHPFSQVDSSISRRYGGSGLGLTITQQLLKLMGSELQINSVKGVGSTFSFEIFLPFDDSEAKAPERLPAPIKVVAPIIETSPEDDLNTSELMISLDNDWGLANELFSLFIQTALPHLDDIAKEISQQNYQAAHHLVHDLKGSASTLGAKNLQQAAQQLDNALRHNQFEPALFDEFKRQLLKAMRAIENLLEAQSKIQPVEALTVESADDSQAVESADDLRERNHALADKYILVAEDNHFAQLAVKELLQLFGARVDVVPNGKLALERLAEQHYDVVLMDLHMPVMDGAEATTKIRSQVQFANLPIIAFSADDSDYERANCLALGMNDAIVKGSNSEKLVQLLCYWIEKNSPSVSAEPETSPTVVAIADTVNPPAPTAKAPITPLLAKKNLITKVSSLDLKGVIAMADSLASADGKDDLIKQLLQAFYDDTRSALQDIAEYFEHEHFQEPRRIVHSIKGSAGILGAHKLQNSAAKLNYSLNSGKIDQLAYQDFQDDLIETRDMIAKLLG